MVKLTVILALVSTGLTILQDRLEAPFANRLLRGRGEDRGTAQHVKILNDAVGADDGLQHHRSLHIHVLRQQRIRRRRRVRIGDPFALGCIVCDTQVPSGLSLGVCFGMRNLQF